MVQFDSERLEADGLDLTPFVSVASFATRVDFVRATTLGNLLERLAALDKREYDVIATIGHSNARTIRIAPDSSVSWAAYAEYLKRFAPRRLAIVGCLAGQYPSTGKIFAALPTLRRIYAPPALANRFLASVMILSLPHLLRNKVPDRDLLLSLQAGLALKGRQLWEWRRTDWERSRDDLLAPIRHEIVRRLSVQIVEWISSKGECTPNGCGVRCA